MAQLVHTCSVCLKLKNGACTEPPKTCGGPLSGMAYPKYEGPLKGHFDKWCFICGATSDAAAEVLGEPGKIGALIGVCKAHVHVLETYSESSKPPAFVTHTRHDVKT